MTELSRPRSYSADLQRVAVRYRAERELAASVYSLHNAIAGHALRQTGVSLQLYPHLLAKAHPEPGLYVDDTTGRSLQFHSHDELRYDIARTLPQSGKIDIRELSVHMLRRQDEPSADGDFRALLRADLPEVYQQKLEKIITKYSGHRLLADVTKLSQGALFLMLRSHDLAPELAAPAALEEKVDEINAELGGRQHKAGDALANPTVNVLRFMNFHDIGVHVERHDT